MNCGCTTNTTPVDICKDVVVCKYEYDAYCIKMKKALTCLNLPANSRLETILLAIDSKLCQSSNPWSNYDYSCLAGEFPATQQGFVEGISEIICNIQQDVSTLTEITNCPTWFNFLPAGSTPSGQQVPFDTGWENANDVMPVGLTLSPAAYCINNGASCNVTLKGYVKGTFESAIAANVWLITTLPVGVRPTEVRIFPTSIHLEGTISGSYDGNAVAAFFWVKPDGQVLLTWNGRIGTVTVTDTTTIFYTSLETIKFQTN